MGIEWNKRRKNQKINLWKTSKNHKNKMQGAYMYKGGFFLFKFVSIISFKIIKVKK